MVGRVAVGRFEPLCPVPGMVPGLEYPGLEYPGLGCGGQEAGRREGIACIWVSGFALPDALLCSLILSPQKAVRSGRSMLRSHVCNLPEHRQTSQLNILHDPQFSIYLCLDSPFLPFTTPLTDGAIQ